MGIMSSADDMAKYIRYILKLGKTDNGKQLVDESLMRQAFIGTNSCCFLLLFFYDKNN